MVIGGVGPSLVPYIVIPHPHWRFSALTATPPVPFLFVRRISGVFVYLVCLFVLVNVGYFPPVSGPGFESREMNLARHLLSRLGKPANHISINGGKSRKRSERARQTPTKHHKHDKHRQQTTNKPPKTTSLRPLFPLFFCPNHRIASPPPVLIV